MFTIGVTERQSCKGMSPYRRVSCRKCRWRREGEVSASAKKLALPLTSASNPTHHVTPVAPTSPREDKTAKPNFPSPLQALQEQQRLTRAAASRIWHEHRPYLYGLSLRWLRGDRAEAEDAVADVLYKASVTIGIGRQDIANERAWLTRVLHNRCMDTHRSRFGIERFEPASNDGEDRESNASADSSAEELLLNKELGAMINQALAALPDQLRGPVTMRLINDEPYTSISETFRISQANARKRIQQAREILRRRLEEYLTGETRPGGQRAAGLRKPNSPLSD